MSIDSCIALVIYPKELRAPDLKDGDPLPWVQSIATSNNGKATSEQSDHANRSDRIVFNSVEGRDVIESVREFLRQLTKQLLLYTPPTDFDGRRAVSDAFKTHGGTIPYRVLVKIEACGFVVPQWDLDS